MQRLESLAKGYQERLLIRGFKDLEDQVQKLTDKFIAEIDGAIAEKTKEIMTV